MVPGGVSSGHTGSAGATHLGQTLLSVLAYAGTWLVTLSFCLLVNWKALRVVPRGHPSPGASCFLTSIHWGVCVSRWTLLQQSWAMWIPGIMGDRKLIWLACVSLCSGARCKCSHLERNVKWRAKKQGHCYWICHGVALLCISKRGLSL